MFHFLGNALGFIINPFIKLLNKRSYEDLFNPSKPDVLHLDLLDVKHDIAKEFKDLFSLIISCSLDVINMLVLLVLLVVAGSMLGFTTGIGIALLVYVVLSSIELIIDVIYLRLTIIDYKNKFNSVKMLVSKLDILAIDIIQLIDLMPQVNEEKAAKTKQSLDHVYEYIDEACFKPSILTNCIAIIRMNLISLKAFISDAAEKKVAENAKAAEDEQVRIATEEAIKLVKPAAPVRRPARPVAKPVVKPTTPPTPKEQ